ncbi:MAG: ASKHA domain-containing protein [Methanomassiliicoccales archaeon]|nr:ASKHA domain-containing protein [Methanomassiliicoccales archaeon]
MAKIHFEPAGRIIDISDERITVAEAAERASVPLDSVCGGRGTCGRCRVIVTSEDALITEEDRKAIDPRDLDRGVRLACRMKADHDLVVEIPTEFARSSQIILEDSAIDIEIKPRIRWIPLRVPPPSLDFQVGDFERLSKVLEDRLGTKSLLASLPIMNSLNELLRIEGEVTAILRGNELIGMIPPKPKERYGMAIDVGTTTVVAYLMDLESGKEVAVKSAMNPQIGYGDDVVSRITFAMERRNGTSVLQSLIVSCINDLIDGCCAATCVSRNDIYEIVAVGNTAMHHMLFGLTTSGLAFSPYVPVISDPVEFKAKEIGIDIAPEGYVHSLPNVAGFVGADHVAVLLASHIWESVEPRLVIDIGTNGEISLGDSERIVCASCAAGPAFEGASLKFGMRGTEGAIDHVSISKDYTVKYTTIGGTPPRGLCGSGAVDAISEMSKTGVIDRTGRIMEELEIPGIRVRNGESEFVIAAEKESAINEPITITQDDVVQIQYAKAAMYAGACILMDSLGINASRLNAIMLAGAFGNYLSPESARTIGLIPEVPLQRVIGIGNAAGAGAKMALLNEDFRERAREILRKVEYIELAAHSGFEELFYRALYIPNYDTSSFPGTTSDI